MEEDLQKTKKDILRVQTSINQCLDNNDDKRAMYYAQKLVTLQNQQTVYESKLPELQAKKDEQEGLEEVREGARRLNEQAKGASVAYESSAETLDYRMEQDERQQEAQAILDQMKNARK